VVETSRVVERHLVNALYAISGDSHPPSVRHSLDRIADAIFDLAAAVRESRGEPPAAADQPGGA
jgi:hypothetical protein